MAKRALCIGINDYPYENQDLKGCVNDAHAWAELLLDHFDFPSADILILTDSEATKKRIIGEVKNLLRGARAEDVLVFTNSSHGSYVADTSRDEPTYDEVVCPYDCDQPGGLLVDDELRELFVKVPEGVHLTVLSDSCFSGTLTRKQEEIEDKHPRFLSPRDRWGFELENVMGARPKSSREAESSMKELLLSGASDAQFAYDAYLGNTFHGAMTYYAIQTIREADYRISYENLHARVVQDLKDNGFEQTPQLEGKRENKMRTIFS